MDLLKIAARVASTSLQKTAAGLSDEPLNMWHNQVVKPLTELVNISRNMIGLTERNMMPENEQQAAAAIQQFVQKWDPQLKAIKTDMGSVGKSVGDAIVQSKSR